MAVLDPVRARVLAVRTIAAIDRDLAAKLALGPGHASVGLLTCDIDDACHVGIDHATKVAQVEVVYARSFYAGARHASGPLSGEILAILAGPDPGEVEAGLAAAIAHIRDEALWYSANDDGTLAFFPHLVPRSGLHLSRLAGVAPGEPLAYLVAPPLEGTFALDAALKAADVRIAQYFPPPSETNYTGALLTGSLAACTAACAAFQRAVLDVACRPLAITW
ncbi:MAG: ethanolamine utilization microcompartment protein EutL [Candidatus Schekmanbacteria bacterium]|nr:ethanolamine utilization microcompartment protein EutL [Candidatus Schekmanbacteria bacterium]